MSLIKQIRDTLQKVYLEWVNDYLTTQQMAEHYGLEYDDMKALVDTGMRIHDERTKANDSKD